MLVSIIWLSIVAGLFFILYKRWCKLYDYWEERGIIHPKPYPLVGNMLDNLLRKKTPGEILRDIAMQYNDQKFIGVYNFITADLMINDIDNIQIVLMKEFSYFADRGPELKNPRFMDKHLFVLTGAEWKGVRSEVSPIFSSGKLKSMIHLMMKSYENTSQLLEKTIESNSSINLTDLLNFYIINVSASTIFGIDPSELTKPDSEFIRIIDNFSSMDLKRFLSLTMSVFFPSLAAKLDLSPMGAEIENYFINLVLNTFKERSESGIVRNDIIQLLLELKQSGKIEVSQWISEDQDDQDTYEPSAYTETIEITDGILVSQGLTFLMTGLDTQKSTLAMLLVELCQNENALTKLREEIEICISKNEGFTWNALKDMQYLDWCISETLRLYPSVEFFTRHCVKEFTFSEGITVEKGTRILIPTLKFHLDPLYFPEPYTFKPERFQSPPLPWVYMPFGLGPRMCIAKRFALQAMKLFIARLVLNYDIELDSRTKIPVEADKWFFLRRHCSPIYLKFFERKILK